MIPNKTEVGEVRPSQVLMTFGIGSIIDLPNVSVMVMGLEDWPISYAAEISEERLLLSVQQALGAPVARLLTPPKAPESSGTQLSPFDERAYVGVPVAPFPRWLVCPACQYLGPLSSDLFELKTFPYRPDKTCYVHKNCQKAAKPPIAVPARFVIACKHGHLSDFPWVEFVHRGKTDCRYQLRLYELGASGEAADVEVKCEGTIGKNTPCTARRRMAEAFGKVNAPNMPACRGRRPHLRDFEPDGCEVLHVTAMLQGASNSWFPVALSALSIPTATDKLGQLVDENWEVLEKVENPEFIAFARKIGQLKDFASFSDAEIWAAVQKKKAPSSTEAIEPTDLKSPEWRVFTNSMSGPASRDFKLRAVQPPDGYRKQFEKIVLVERLREVRALIGFTRIESPGDYDTPFQIPEDQLAPLSRNPPTWVPATEIRGEGIFFEFSESAIDAWASKLQAYDDEFKEAHKRWRESRNLPESGYPRLRCILLHSFAHAVIRQLAVECGYTAASIRERIYARSPEDGDPMAGVLIYTAAPDSEGTLGGLVSLGEPDTLGRHLDQALDAVRLCASDPSAPNIILTRTARRCTGPLATPACSCRKPRANGGISISTARFS
jgi:hypothetical protein